MFGGPYKIGSPDFGKLPHLQKPQPLLGSSGLGELIKWASEGGFCDLFWGFRGVVPSAKMAWNPKANPSQRGFSEGALSVGNRK